MSGTEDLDLITFERGGTTAVFSGTWYRGEFTDFIPNKAELRSSNAVDRFVMPGWEPNKPFIDKTTAITAFGSCFAANISSYLGARGYNVFGSDLGLDAHIIRFGEGMVNTFAIRQQFEWAFGERTFPDNLWFGPNKEIAAMNPAIQKQTYDIINATDTFVITLGLSEIWYDKVSGDAFWRAIPSAMFDSEIHGFRLSTVAENHENLRVIYRCIRRSRPHANIVFTLSPIPLMATFRPISCITANSVSKAILRVAIDEFMRENSSDKSIFYFPSYEIVNEVFVDPRVDDNRHLKSEVITSVMETFVRHYCIADGRDDRPPPGERTVIAASPE